MPDAAAAFFSIPELTLELCHHLMAGDFLNLMLTSRYMHNTCRPLFWNTLFLRDDYLAGRFTDPVANKEGLASLGRNIDSVRTFQTRGNFMSFYIVALCKYLDDNDNSRNSNNSAASTPSSEQQQESQVPTRRPEWVPYATLDETENAPALPPFTKLTNFRASMLYGDMLEWEHYGSRSILRAAPLTLQASWIMSLNPNLTDVFLHGADLEDGRVVRCLARTISNLRHLKDLTIQSAHATHILFEVAYTLFRSCPQAILSLKLPMDVKDRLKGEAPIGLDDKDIDAGPVVLRTEPLANLRYLQLPDKYNGYTVEQIHHFLGHCPRLESWHLPCIAESTEPGEIAKIIRTDCKEIKHLINERPYGNFKGAFVMAVMEAIDSPQLETLELTSYQDEWPGQMAASIQRHCKVLQSIKLRGCHYIKSSTIHTIFTSCRELRHLEIEGTYPNRTAMSLEDAGSAKEWVCTKLRHLVLYVTVPSISTSVEQLPWDLLEGFYRHLGSLHELEFLNLKGASYRLRTLEDGQVVRSDAEYDRLTFPGLFSLGDPSIGEPGFLSLLKDLNRLTTFQGSLLWCSMRAEEPRGQKEMEWVVKHWPMLKIYEIMDYSHIDMAEDKFPYLTTLREQMPQLKISKPLADRHYIHGMSQNSQRNHVTTPIPTVVTGALHISYTNVSPTQESYSEPSPSDVPSESHFLNGPQGGDQANGGGQQAGQGQGQEGDQQDANAGAGAEANAEAAEPE
ncbi:hypothetical protein BGW39_002404 [Mortierella sp. 14UC]|nr:hypothetical protein BGW39_002404 [Mortierella sp. 14UC]